jgi:predicted PurR-regulated permease PerM
MRTGQGEFLKRTLIVVAVATLPVLIWYLSGVLLMAFGAIVFALLLRLIAEPFVRWLSLPQSVALLLSGLVILAVIGGAGYLFGTRISAQLQDVIDRASSGTAAVQNILQNSPFGKFLLGHLNNVSFSITDVLSGVLSMSTRAVEGLAILLISGIYLAAQPELYRRGVISLFPPRAHRRAAETFDEIGAALRLWLIGQLIQMLLIGTLASLAVWIIGVPSPLALGLIAAVGEFIPYLGPILAAIPAVLVAFTVSNHAALWTLLAYIAINQIEGNLIVPLVQRHLVAIPPAVMLLGIVAITYLFGPIFILFAAPMAVVIFAAVNLLYIRDTLHEKTAITKALE